MPSAQWDGGSIAAQLEEEIDQIAKETFGPKVGGGAKDAWKNFMALSKPADPATVAHLKEMEKIGALTPPAMPPKLSLNQAAASAQDYFAQHGDVEKAVSQLANDFFAGKIDLEQFHTIQPLLFAAGQPKMPQLEVEELLFGMGEGYKKYEGLIKELKDKHSFQGYDPESKKWVSTSLQALNKALVEGLLKPQENSSDLAFYQWLTKTLK